MDTKIQVTLNGETREIEAVRDQFGTGLEYFKVQNVAIKTSSGAKLHCGTLYVDINNPNKIIDVVFNGALGNGVGFASKFSFFDWADKYTMEQFSKATQSTYTRQNGEV